MSYRHRAGNGETDTCEGWPQKVTHSRSHQRQRKRPGGRMIEQHERAYVARRARGRVSNPCLPRGHHRTYLHQTPALALIIHAEASWAVAVCGVV